MEKLNYPIGGYFELELNKSIDYHRNAIALNTARNALEYILIAKKYQKVYIPYFTCDVILEPFQKLNIAYEFYKIDENFECIDSPVSITEVQMKKLVNEIRKLEKIFGNQSLQRLSTIVYQ